MVKSPRPPGAKGPYAQSDVHLLGTQRLEVKAVMNEAASTAIQTMATERTNQDKEHTKQLALLAVLASVAMGAVTLVALVGPAIAVKWVAIVATTALASLGAATGVREILMNRNKSPLALPDPIKLLQPPDHQPREPREPRE